MLLIVPRNANALLKTLLNIKLIFLHRLKSVGTATKKDISSVAVIEGLVGFACVPVPFSTQYKSSSLSLHINDSFPSKAASSSTSPSAYYYACTVTSPQMLLERLNKDISVVANGPVNLLETIGIEIQFRKVLTRKSKMF